MSNAQVEFIREHIADIPMSERSGYVRALTDMIKVSLDVPVKGEYIDGPLTDLIQMVTRAKKLPVINLSQLT